jgi:hypothetical protein
MANLVNTGLGGHRIKKEAAKKEGYYWNPPLWIPGSGIQFRYVDITTQEDLEGASHDAAGRKLYAQASQTITGLQVTTSGYTGTVSGTMHLAILNGLIVDVY